MRFVPDTTHARTTLKRPYTAGFTLVEMMVALGIFAMVVTTAVGAFLVLIASNRTLQADQIVMNNLTFLMDNMTRELRTGTAYYCADRPHTGATGNSAPDDTDVFNNVDQLLESTQDCPEGVTSGGTRVQGVAFIETGGSIAGSYGSGNRISYYFDSNPDGNNNTDDGTIMRKVGDNAAESMVSSGISIKHAEFFVTGAEQRGYGDNDTVQPTVTIFIQAVSTEDDFDNPVNPFYLQTTVSQRRLDL